MTPTPPRKNSGIPKSLQLKKLAELVGGELVGDASVTITGVAGIREAGPGEITFLANPKYASLLNQTRASAVITFQNAVSRTKPLVRTPNPSLAFSKVISFFTPSKPERAEGVHPSAVVDPSATVGRGVSVGPHAVIGKNTRIGGSAIIESNCSIGADCAIGEGTWIYPNVTIREGTEIGNNVIIHSGAVIGSDGFGYETVDGVHVKIPQTGSVKIEDDVEIGANVCIDRGRFQKTWIQKGTKIDNLVQVAHNVVIGPNCLIVSQTGISGSTELGKNVIVAGQAGIIGHIKLEDGVIVGARAGVNKSVPANTVVLGEPARPIMEQKKLFALIGRLPELFKEVLEIKKKLK